MNTQLQIGYIRKGKSEVWAVLHYGNPFYHIWAERAGSKAQALKAARRELDRRLLGPDVQIFYNGWISPRSRKALTACGCGVKTHDVTEAMKWCKAQGLSHNIIDMAAVIEWCEKHNYGNNLPPEVSHEPTTS